MAAGFFFASSAHAQFIISERPAMKRGGVGTFQQLWVYRVEKEPQAGIASIFDDKMLATGPSPPDDTSDLTCSHTNKSELGQVYRVTRLGKSITCTVRDIGPHPRLKRALDMKPKGAALLGITTEMGIAPVTIERLSIAKK